MTVDDTRFNLMLSNDGEYGSACIFDKELGLVEMLTFFEEHDNKEDYCDNLKRIVDLLNNLYNTKEYYRVELDGLKSIIQDKSRYWDECRFEIHNSAFRNRCYYMIMEEIGSIFRQIENILKKEE